jgi:hypothetical protein
MADIQTGPYLGDERNIYPDHQADKEIEIIVWYRDHLKNPVFLRGFGERMANAIKKQDPEPRRICEQANLVQKRLPLHQNEVALQIH